MITTENGMNSAFKQRTRHFNINEQEPPKFKFGFRLDIIYVIK